MRNPRPGRRGGSPRRFDLGFCLSLGVLAAFVAFLAAALAGWLGPNVRDFCAATAPLLSIPIMILVLWRFVR